jgi:hypothetical protein
VGGLGGRGVKSFLHFKGSSLNLKGIFLKMIRFLFDSGSALYRFSHIALGSAPLHPYSLTITFLERPSCPHGYVALCVGGACIQPARGLGPFVQSIP